ncbi:hypothetical protein ACA910_017236 [Epithemia clementina (nom. ined.)]
MIVIKNPETNGYIVSVNGQVYDLDEKDYIRFMKSTKDHIREPNDEGVPPTIFYNDKSGKYVICYKKKCKWMNWDEFLACFASLFVRYLADNSEAPKKNDEELVKTLQDEIDSLKELLEKASMKKEKV